ncbi:hypothetical protein ACIBHX_02210 [Nonomuraea sp. NPDC050536]|uniref:hypothetical protein n=1 Tax=Nonomuraea sp. NPDC050536 TaxID=3364366 RepID=UPI0037C91BA7
MRPPLRQITARAWEIAAPSWWDAAWVAVLGFAAIVVVGLPWWAFPPLLAVCCSLGYGLIAYLELANETASRPNEPDQDA